MNSQREEQQTHHSSSESYTKPNEYAKQTNNSEAHKFPAREESRGTVGISPEILRADVHGVDMVLETPCNKEKYAKLSKEYEDLS